MARLSLEQSPGSVQIGYSACSLRDVSARRGLKGWIVEVDVCSSGVVAGRRNPKKVMWKVAQNSAQFSRDEHRIGTSDDDGDVDCDLVSVFCSSVLFQDRYIERLNSERSKPRLKPKGFKQILCRMRQGSPFLGGVFCLDSVCLGN